MSLLAHVYLTIDRHMPPLMTSSNINNIFLSVNFIFVFFKHAFRTNPGADTKCAGP